MDSISFSDSGESSSNDAVLRAVRGDMWRNHRISRFDRPFITSVTTGKDKWVHRMRIFAEERSYILTATVSFRRIARTTLHILHFSFPALVGEPSEFEDVMQGAIII